MGDQLDDESFGTLCEALLHFMLTASLLPSERKVNWKGAELDLVVPSLKMLSKSPEKSLVIQIIKGNGDLTKIKHAPICAASRWKYLDRVSKAARGRS